MLISPGSVARPSCSHAKACLASVDPALLPLPARAAVRAARLIERPVTSGSANRVATAITRLGPTYVKLGQFLATRPDVVGVAIARDLETLQDKMAPFPQAEAERTVETALGEPLDRLYVTFGPAVACRLDGASASRRCRNARPAGAPSP